MATPETDFDVAARIAPVSPLVGIRAKAAPRHTALVVIDMRRYSTFYSTDLATAVYSRADHEMILANIDGFFGEVTSIAELQSLWPPRNRAEARRWSAV